MIIRKLLKPSCEDRAVPRNETLVLRLGHPWTLQYLTLSISGLAEGRLVTPPQSLGLLSAICACKQLRSLMLMPEFASLEVLGLGKNLLQCFVASLPELRVLLLQEDTDVRGALNDVFSENIIAEVAAKREPGLQLLLTDVCNAATDFSLPVTLRYLFITNWCNQDHEQLYRTLKCLCNVEELYLVGFHGRHIETGQSNAPLLQTYETLRIIIVDFYDAPCEVVCSAVLPSLELLALPGTIPRCATTTSGTRALPPVKPMCPTLKEVFFSCVSEKDIPILEHLLSTGAPKLETVQVAVDFEFLRRRENQINIFQHLWRALARSSSLRNLKLIFRNYDERSFDERVQVAFLMMYGVSLPSLETLGLYSFESFQGGGPRFELGSSVAYEQGVRGVCKEIGRLVSEGALPSLKLVNMFPGSDEAGGDGVGHGPQLEEAPHVKTFFLPEPDGWQNGGLAWIRPSHLDAELQRRIMAALTDHST
ncbi:hypothetical protein COCOBI_17-2770 [Coccomyxa sp. Obi]|nr:hypothetical protein COCOBI_17-2770 [Coccomyxa sp. Obi]